HLSYRELTAMPAVEQFMTLECVSNKIGGHLISNAKWTGVRLRDLLNRAGVRPGAVEVVSRAVDGFADSVPIDDALAPTTLVAFGGDRGISRVEVSTDGGHTFSDAELKTPLSRFTWRQWRFRFTPRTGAHAVILVRATDGAGRTQTSAVTPPEYSGATGLDGV